MTATGVLTSIGSSPASMSQDGAVSASIPSRHWGKLDTFGMPGTGGYYAAFLSSGLASGSGTAPQGLYVYCKCSGSANGGSDFAPYSSDGEWLGADAIGY